MDVNDWPTRLKGCRTSATGTLRDVLSLRPKGQTPGACRPAIAYVLPASGRDAQSFAVIPMLASSPVPAPGATPPRREHFLGLDCE